jgi:predicted small secreted protein
MPMRKRNLRTLAVVAAMATAGCNTLTAGGDRQAYVRDSMRDYRFPRACEALWVDALKVISSQGFDLVGSDRELAGQEKQGVVSNFLNRGHATWRNDDGLFEAESDSDRQGLRFVIRGKPAGPDGCFVTYTAVQEDKANSTETRNRDYDQELLLLSRIDPGAAAKIYEGADKPK